MQPGKASAPGRFNGASFLDFAHDISSLIMALLAFAAIACYSIALFIAGQPAPHRAGR